METVKKTVQQELQEIIAALEQAGLNPYSQLSGYLRTGNDAYITRIWNARERIKQLDPALIRQYIRTLRQSEG